MKCVRYLVILFQVLEIAINAKYGRARFLNVLTLQAREAGQLIPTLYYMRHYTLNYSVITPAVIVVLRIINSAPRKLQGDAHASIVDIASIVSSREYHLHTLHTRQIAFTLQ